MTGRRSLPIPSYPTTNDAITNVVALFDRVTGIVNVARTTLGAICAKKMGIADIGKHWHGSPAVNGADARARSDTGDHPAGRVITSLPKTDFFASGGDIFG